MRNIKKFGLSLQAALRGLGHAFTHERNFRYHVAVAVAVVIMMLFFDLQMWEYVVLVVVMVNVMVAELINTGFEKVVDILKPRINPVAKDIKDLAAGVVLLTAIAAVIIGIVILGPHVITMLSWL